MPVIHVATHLGYHPVLGAPTGKKVTYAGKNIRAYSTCFYLKYL